MREIPQEPSAYAEDIAIVIFQTAQETNESLPICHYIISRERDLPDFIDQHRDVSWCGFFACPHEVLRSFWNVDSYGEVFKGRVKYTLPVFAQDVILYQPSS